MSTPWSPQQREALTAMGLPVYRMADSITRATAPADAPAEVAVNTQAAVRDEQSGTVSTLDPLLLAMLRAAGLGRDGAPLARDWPPPQALRHDPQAKRALWPRLRALRRSPA